MKLKYQNGAVMIEAAYVLPIMVAVVLFIVEAMAFAMNAFAANDVLTDVHTRIISDVADVSNASDGAASGFAVCESGQVKLSGTAGSEINTHVQSALSEKGVTFSNGPVTTVSESVTDNGFTVYVINVTGTANALLFPNVSDLMLPINVDTIVSLKDSCVTS